MTNHSAHPILVVDDDPKIVRLVQTYLERERFTVRTATDGRAALAAIEQLAPALVVLDLMLPELDGRAVIRAVRGRDSSASTPILVLSARGSTIDRIGGLEDGADDYLPKPFSPGELVLRVKAILRRSEFERTGPQSSTGATQSGEVLVHGDVVIDTDRYQAKKDGITLPLTLMEFRLLATLLRGAGRVLSRDELLDAVYGHGATEVFDRTIDVHIGRLREKLGDEAEHPHYIATVRGVGYRAVATGADGR